MVFHFVELASSGAIAQRLRHLPAEWQVRSSNPTCGSQKKIRFALKPSASFLTDVAEDTFKKQSCQLSTMVKKILSRKDLIKKAPQIHRFHWNSMTYGAIEIEIEIEIELKIEIELIT